MSFGENRAAKKILICGYFKVSPVLLLCMSMFNDLIVIMGRLINISVIAGLWNMVFLGSNVSLFLLLPFAYFFTESEGLAGSKKVHVHCKLF